jgi:glutamate synthase domain-containing protein 2
LCFFRVVSGFSIVRNLALGADVCNAARAMMFALGCIQALKCNTNMCPTGVATQDPDLMSGLNPSEKRFRVFNYHKNTMHAAAEIIGAAGYDCPSGLKASDIQRRTSGGDGIATYDSELRLLVYSGQILVVAESVVRA